MLYSPVFIISEPRSGSTWLQKALTSHPDIFCTELRLFGNLFDTLIDLNKNGTKTQRNRSSLESYLQALSLHAIEGGGVKRVDFTNDLERLLSRKIFQYLSQKTQKKIIVDKFTSNDESHVLKKCQRCFPEAKYIYLCRDGRDIAVSKFFDWVTKVRKGQSFDENSPIYKKYILKQSVVVERLFTDKLIEQHSKRWQKHVDLYANNCEMQISYEAMIENQVDVLDKLFNFIGAENSQQIRNNCAQEASFTKMAGGRQKSDGQEAEKVRSGIAGGWKKYFTRADGEIFQENAGETLVKLGYENDEKWVNELPDRLAP